MIVLLLEPGELGWRLQGLGTHNASSSLGCHHPEQRKMLLLGHHDVMLG